MVKLHLISGEQFLYRKFWFWNTIHVWLSNGQFLKNWKTRVRFHAAIYTLHLKFALCAHSFSKIYSNLALFILGIALKFFFLPDLGALYALKGVELNYWLRKNIYNFLLPWTTYLCSGSLQLLSILPNACCILQEISSDKKEKKYWGDLNDRTVLYWDHKPLSAFQIEIRAWKMDIPVKQ